MPVQTRAGAGGGHQSAAVAEPPAPKTYKSKPAAPKQQHFSHRRRHIKTYGHDRPSKFKSPGQGTLTQMDFVTPSPADVHLIDDDENDNEDQEEIELQQIQANKSKAKSSRTNRRRTTGDEEEPEKARGSKRRRTMGDTPSVSVSSSFHTQTLTQFLSSKKEGEIERDLRIEDSEAETDLGLIEETPTRDVRTRDALETPSGTEARVPSKGSQLLRETPKETPSNQRSRLLEIPSSQSPATPMLLRYSPAKEPSPLKARSSNIGTQISTPKGIRKTPRTLAVQDTYSTTHSSPTTPTPKVRDPHSSGAKRLRFELPENKENITPGRTKPKSPKTIFEKASNRQPLREIPDSDEEDPDATESEEEEEKEEEEKEEEEKEEEEKEEEEKEEEEKEEEDVSVAGRRNDESAILGNSDIVSIAEDNSVENYDVSAETQAIMITSDDRPSDEEEEEEETTVSEPRDKAGTALEGSKGDAQLEDEELTPVARPSRRLQSSPNKLVAEEPTPDTPTQAYTQACTQGLESQRVPLSTIQATGPISDRSDIIVSIYGEHVKRMVERTKTHEFRSWKMPESVHRVWVYITKPASELRYMFLMGPPKTRGEIDDDGIGNAEFNAGKKKAVTYAYEALQIYELNNPVSLETMKQYGWPTAPQKYAYVPPAIVGQLTANLRCALFDEEEEDIEQSLIRSSPVRSSPNVTVSQEIAEQIRSDISHSTQLASDPPEIIPASPTPRKRAAPRDNYSRNNMGDDDDNDDNVFVRPVMPRSLSGALAAAAAGQESQRNNRGSYVRASQATTVSQVSTSSPVPSPEKVAPLPPAHYSAVPSSSAPVGSSSPPNGRSHRHSLRSSQLPTKSQMLPDSLINQQIEGPPSIIWDSADDSE
ncbi:uncharacterized protein PG986_001408 [Apiospora aurea]|uniref:Uncharacterized protein n=1 Tax=Apiospora aurea TaxID=335848 RepID=A0ABR1QWT2_9PEZI